MSSKEKNRVIKKLEKITFLDPELLYYPLSGRNIKYFIDGKAKLFKEDLMYENSNRKFYSTV